MNTKEISVVLVVVVRMFSVVSADITLDVLPDRVTPSPGPFTNSAGNTVNELNVSFDSEIGANQLLVELTQGQMILAMSGFEPGPGSMVNDNETFITMGGRTFFDGGNSSVPGGATLLNSACVTAGSCEADGSETYAADLLDVTWLDPNSFHGTGGPGFLVAQIVLSPDAAGTWSYLGTSDGGNDYLVHTGPVGSVIPINIGVVAGGVLSIRPPVPTSTDLGVIGLEGLPIAVDTMTSNFDTELGLYDFQGNLLAENDNAIGLQSKLDIPGGLSAGIYFLALGGFDTTFANGFQTVPGPSNGSYAINHKRTLSRGLAVLTWRLVRWQFWRSNKRDFHGLASLSNRVLMSSRRL